MDTHDSDKATATEAAIEDATKAYLEATAAARKARNETVVAATKAYLEAAGPAMEAYLEAIEVVVRTGDDESSVHTTNAKGTDDAGY